MTKGGWLFNAIWLTVDRRGAVEVKDTLKLLTPPVVNVSTITRSMARTALYGSCHLETIRLIVISYVYPKLPRKSKIILLDSILSKKQEDFKMICIKVFSAAQGLLLRT